MVASTMWLLVSSILAALLVKNSSAQTCSVPTCSTSSQVALLPANQSSNDHIYIGGIFGIHEAGKTQYECGKVRERGIQNLEAFFWAVRTFKERYPTKLQGVDVGAIAFDSCSSSERAIQQVLNLENCVVGYGDPPVQPSRVLGFVGPDSSSEALQLAPILGGMEKTLISHAATSASLSKMKKFLRTVPSDAEQGFAIASILEKQNWKYIQTVNSANSYGTAGIEAFQKAAQDHGVCIVNAEVIPESPTTEDMEDIIENLMQRRQTKVVVVFANDHFVRDLLIAARSKGIRRVFTWIGTNSWGTSKEVVKGVEVYAEGSVTMGFDSSQDFVDDFMDEFETYSPISRSYNPWFQQYWEEKFDCFLPGGTNNGQQCNVNAESLKDISVDTYVPFAIMAADAMLAGISDARDSACSQPRGLCSSFLSDRWSRLEDKIRAVKIHGMGFNNATGDSVGVKQYIYNYRSPNQFGCDEHCYEAIGTYRNNLPDVEFAGLIYSYFENGTRDENPTTVCSTSRPCQECGETTMPPTTVSTTTKGDEDPDPAEANLDPPVEMRDDSWVIVLIILAGLGILMVVAFEVYLMSKMFDTPFITHFRTMWLGQLLLFAIFLSYLTLFAFVPSPTNATCGILRFGIGGCYAMCFAVLLVKLMIIHSSETIGYLKGIYQILMFIFAWGVQIAIDVMWLILREPQAVYDAEEERWTCKQDFKTHVYTLPYVMFLILICTIMSMKTHGIATNHREGIFVGLSAGFAIPVWLAWILLGALDNNSDYRDPCLAFGLLVTVTLIFFIMFLPKVRQLNNIGLEGIYAEDDRPTPEYPHSIMAPSVRPAESMMPPGSIIANNVAYLSDRNIGYAPSQVLSQKLDLDAGSLIQVDGDVIKLDEAATLPRMTHLQYDSDPSALYIRHPGVSHTDTLPGSASVRSVPIGTQPVTLSGPPSSRVLRVTNDLTGRTPVDDRIILSTGEPVYYGTTRSAHSAGSAPSAISLRKTHSFHELGSL